MRLPELWRMSGRAGGLPGSPIGRPEHPRVTLADRAAGLAGRITWETGRIMGRLDARITGTADEPSARRVLAVAATASGAWVTACALVWAAARRWGR